MRRFAILDAPQRSEDWFAARLGRVTGSRAEDVLASIKSGEAAKRRDYRMELVTERLTGCSAEAPYVNDDMQRGIDLEPQAFALYEALTGRLVDRTGFLSHLDLMAGCSLDGHVGDFEGLIEIKCPRSANHLTNLRAKGVPAKYLPQIRHNLWITGAAWCDFVSFDPRWPEEYRLHIARVLRDDVDLAGYEAEVRRFLADVDNEVQALKGWRAVEGVA